MNISLTFPPGLDTIDSIAILAGSIYITILILKAIWEDIK